MTRQFASAFRGGNLSLLRLASLLVPRQNRGEWWREWRSELWHVRQACTTQGAFPWEGEREVAAFCLGAFQDAFYLRREVEHKKVPLATTKGSAAQCMLFLVTVMAVSYCIAFASPGVRAELLALRYRVPQNLTMIQSARYNEDSIPTVSAEQVRTWKRRKQQIFDGFAFYQIVQKPVSTALPRQTTLRIARASSNLFELLGLPVRLASTGGHAQGEMPKLILSNAVWKKEFGEDPFVSGRVVQVGLRKAVVGGVAPARYWRLPGKVDAWLLEPDVEAVSDGAGFVVAHLTPWAAQERWSERWPLSAPTPDGTFDDFLCVSLTERTRKSWDLFLFAVILAFLSLPATTSLPLGEYRLSSRKLSWSTRLRRWTFLGGKIALLLPIVYLVSLDLAYMRTTLDTLSSEYIQLVSSFSICLFGLRWALRDQRQRCPVCLGKLTHPARVGQPSRNFLAWNGTELICIGGHGLLHVPEIQTSWFSTQRWMYLDPSWEILFPESGLVSPGYF
ncbi:MAG: hypothetical protein JWQ49_5840 [Edaphobacter sp.]|nr:hypothetical protein [Edaphobacter sp.]